MSPWLERCRFRLCFNGKNSKACWIEAVLIMTFTEKFNWTEQIVKTIMLIGDNANCNSFDKTRFFFACFNESTKWFSCVFQLWVQSTFFQSKFTLNVFQCFSTKSYLNINFSSECKGKIKWVCNVLMAKLSDFLCSQ